MSCTHDCDRPPQFPATIWNRPGLARFAYRIGRYPTMRAHMLDRLVKDPALLDWSHLDSDDPGIALLDGTALIGDILTFYMELYANETKLGTAAWDESARDLVRLTGYIPAPGLGGEALFAAEVDAPVTIPAGFAFEAQLDGGDGPAKFESSAAVEALPAFGRFNLYRPRKKPQAISAGDTQLDLVELGGADDLATRAEVELTEGDRIMLIPSDKTFVSPGTTFKAQPAPEIAVVKSVDVLLDRVRITIDGALRINRGASITAYRIDRSFRHYGADAPRQFSTYVASPPAVTLTNTQYLRPLHKKTSISGDAYTSFTAKEMPFDQEINDLATGATLICVARGQSSSGGTVGGITMVRTVDEIRAEPVIWGNVEASVSVITLDEDVIPDNGSQLTDQDIRYARLPRDDRTRDDPGRRAGTEDRERSRTASSGISEPTPKPSPWPGATCCWPGRTERSPSSWRRTSTISLRTRLRSRTTCACGRSR